MKKVFKFGDGSVLIEAHISRKTIKLTKIKPPLAYLGEVNDEDLEDREILYTRMIYWDMLSELKKDLSSITGPTILEYEEFTLDFTNYKEESVKNLLWSVERILKEHNKYSFAC